MVDALILTQTVLTALTAIVYLYVGYHLARRRVEGPNRLAAALFATWWIILGGLQIMTLVGRLLSDSGVRDLAVHLTLAEIELLALCIALWALLYYLVFVLTGTRRAMMPLAIFYGAFYVWILYLILSLHPMGVKDAPTGGVQLDFAEEAPGYATFAFIVLLLGPVLVGAIGYFRLYFRVQGTTQRYRIGMIAVTLIAWFGSAAIASASGVSNAAWWRPASTFLGLLAALAIYFAYRPPAFLRRRYGLESVNADA